MAHKKLIVVLTGGPCSGKSTIGKILADIMNARYISSGDIARDMANNDANIKNDLNAGKLAPEDAMRQAICCEILYTFDNVTDTIILDGFPRFGDQAKWLRDNFHPMDGYTIVYIMTHVPSYVMRDRAKDRGRDDDINFEDRLRYYKSVTYKELYDRLDLIIDSELPAQLCAKAIEDFIVKEVL